MGRKADGGQGDEEGAGAVLIRGEKGTAKTTAVRGIASVVLDTEGGYTKSVPAYSTPGRAPEIARALRAKYFPLRLIIQNSILAALRWQRPA